MGKTKVVMLGTGTPDPDPKRSGPCVAVVVDDTSYLIDFGVNVVRQANAAFKNGIKALAPKKLNIAFLTHNHSDHTLGYADLIITPWVVGRKEPLKVIGPKGIGEITTYLLKAYESDIIERVDGFMQADPKGVEVQVTEIEEPGVIYQDELVKVEAIQVQHIGHSYAFKFTTEDKSIVISGDKAPCNALLEFAKDCDILIHEVYPTKNLESRPLVWKNYHSSMHTSSRDVGLVANTVNAKKVVLYHPVYLMGMDAHKLGNIEDIKVDLENYMIEDVKENYSGEVIFANDLDVIE
ncbi:MAG: MBL fold metallo-hydrolase [Eubacteriales bacterium]